jgi:hypothetical protein
MRSSAVTARQPGAEDRCHLVGSQPPQAEFATAFEQSVDREVTLEDEVAALFDLTDGIKARQVKRVALLGGEFRPDDQGPVIESLADDVRA